MPEINPLCLFHVDRLQFDQLEKELKQSKWIPRFYCHRLASAVCSCRKNLDWEPNREELAEHSLHIRAIVYTQKLELSSQLSAFIHKILDSVTPTDFSRCRLLKILCLAEKGDFSFLSRCAISKNSTEKKIKPKSNKFTQKQFECLIRKKRSKLDSEIFELHMFPGNMRKLERRLGSSLGNYSKKERFIYEMKHKRNNTNFNNNVNKTYIQIWGKNRDTINLVKTCLIQKAREAQQQAECERENRRARREQMRSYFRCYHIGRDSEEEEIYDAAAIIKDRLCKDFGKKLRRQDKHTGRCFFLLLLCGVAKTYLTICATREIVASHWSCCGEYVHSILELENEHADTGCITEGIFQKLSWCEQPSPLSISRIQFGYQESSCRCKHSSVIASDHPFFCLQCQLNYIPKHWEVSSISSDIYTEKIQ